MWWAARCWTRTSRLVERPPGIPAPHLSVVSNDRPGQLRAPLIKAARLTPRAFASLSNRPRRPLSTLTEMTLTAPLLGRPGFRRAFSIVPFSDRKRARSSSRRISSSNSRVASRSRPRAERGASGTKPFWSSSALPPMTAFLGIREWACVYDEDGPSSSRRRSPAADSPRSDLPRRAACHHRFLGDKDSVLLNDLFRRRGRDFMPGQVLDVPFVQRKSKAHLQHAIRLAFLQ